LQDEVSPAAQSAAEALGKTEKAMRSYGAAADSLASGIAADSAAINKAAAQLTQLERAGQGGSAAANQLRESIASQRAAVAAAELQWTELTGEVRKATMEERGAAVVAEKVAAQQASAAAQAASAAAQQEVVATRLAAQKAAAAEKEAAAAEKAAAKTKDVAAQKAAAAATAAAQEEAVAARLAAQKSSESAREAAAAEKAAAQKEAVAARMVAQHEAAAAREVAAAERAAAQQAAAAARLAAQKDAVAAREVAAAAKAAQQQQAIAQRLTAAKEAEHQKQAASAQKLADKEAQAAKKTMDLEKGLRGLSPGVGGLIGDIQDMSEGLGGIPLPAAAAAMAVAALGIAVLKAAASMVSLAFQAADAQAHIRAMGVAMEGSTKAGLQLAGEIGRVATRTALASDKVMGFAQALKDGKVEGKAFSSALDTASSIARVMGDSAANAFISAAAEAQKTGKSVEKLAADAKKNLGKSLEMELRRPSVALERLRGELGSLFDTSDVSGFGDAINKVSDALSAGTAVGEAWRTIFSTIFGGLGEDAKSAGDLAVAVLEEMTIMGLKIGIWAKPVARDIKALWKSFAEGDNAKAVAYVLAGVLVSLAAAAAVVGGVAIAVAAGFVQLGVAVSAVIAYAYAFGSAVSSGVSSAWDALMGLPTKAGAALSTFVDNGMSAAKGFIDGLVNGITGGAQWVISAIQNLGASAWQAFKEKLNIGSPSKVMMRLGGYTAEGVAVGIDAGAAEVRSSAEALAAAPAEAAAKVPAAVPALPALAPEPAEGAASTRRSSGAASIDVGGLQITINGVAGAESILERLPAALADAFEQIAESMGVNPAEA